MKWREAMNKILSVASAILMTMAVFSGTVGVMNFAATPERSATTNLA